MNDPHFANDIAIVGMAGRFPNSANLDSFWRNLRDGVECIRTFSDEELLEGGIDVDLLANPNYVKAYGYLDDIDRFDAGFFGFTPREAESLDPQQRVFLEVAWEALEHAGCDPERFAGAVGVYGGTGQNVYYLRNVHTNPVLMETLGYFQTYIGNDKDFVTTRTSYKLNLTGPSINVQTACSTSLVAIHLACQNLLNGECDLALAGGVSIVVTGKEGYLYSEGGVNSPDGHCRPFDAAAQGMVGGDGAGIVVLKRLEDALSEGDTIYAVVKGTAVNNDGAARVGFTAPGVAGQAAVIAEALSVAEIEPRTIEYVEAHGTGTPLGDPVEVEALTRAFREQTDAVGFCALGSVKSNIGHTNTAAGVAGVIKVVLALQHELIPPTLHYQSPNPAIDFANSPFFVAATARPWQRHDRPRRAGVSAFGIGGTNAHVLLEEAPLPAPATPDPRRQQLLTLAAKTDAALDELTGRLRDLLAQNPELDLADAAYTLHLGRAALPRRRAVVLGAARDWDEAAVVDGAASDKAPNVVFMFPGQGAQYANMGRDLYEFEPLYRDWIDRGAEFLRPRLGLDIRALLYPPAGDAEVADARLKQTAITQPVLFVASHALAQLWLAWGIEPAALIGHSVGEYVAACLAGVFTWQTALELLAARGRLIQALPAGAMLAVPLPEAELAPFLDDSLDLAAVNAPDQAVVAGRDEAIAALVDRLAAAGIDARPVATSHAFHSRDMDAMLPEFKALVAQVRLAPPTRRVMSTVSGAWLTAAQATDPGYWTDHVRQTVRFAAGLAALGADAETIMLDVGPGQTLAALARRQSGAVIASSRHPKQQVGDDAALQAALGRLWCAGVAVDWAAYHGPAQRRRVALPTYPFARDRHWSEPGRAALPAGLHKKADPADWLYQPSWQRTPHRPAANLTTAENWLIFGADDDLTAAVRDFLRQSGQRVIVVSAGAAFAAAADQIVIRPAVERDYDALLTQLSAGSGPPRRLLHLWAAGDSDLALGDALARNFYSFVYLARALNRQRISSPFDIVAVSRGLHEVSGGEELRPETSVLLGPIRVLPIEFEHLDCRSVDLTAAEMRDAAALAPQLAAEALSATGPASAVCAYRGRYRWQQTYVAVPHRPADSPWRDGGVYVITGGLGGVGLALAEQLARTADQPRLALVGRSGLPAGDPRQAQITRLAELGATVDIIQADVSSDAQMDAAWARITNRWGPVDGVIHAAGLGGGGGTAQRDPAAIAALLSPKILGTQVISRLLADNPNAVLLLCSSLAATLGGFGQIDYCAANAYLDAFAHWDARRGRATTAVAWELWNDTGMAATELPQDLQARRASAARTGMTRAEGMALLPYVWQPGTAQLLVSTVDLPRRQKEQFNVLTAAPTPAAADSAALPAANAALSPVEQKVTAAWQTLFGLAAIKPDDDFFELGGHSLLATQLLNRLRRDFPEASLALSDVFDHPTIAGIASLIDQAEPPKTADWRQRLAAAETPAAQADILTAYLNQTQPDLDWATLPQMPAVIADLIWALKRDLDFPIFPHELRNHNSQAALAAFIAAERARLRPTAGANRPAPPSLPRRSLSLPPPPATPNPTAVFLLAAPRSGSTLLRLMLAGHPDLFAPPELGLLAFGTTRPWLTSQRGVTTQIGYEQALLALDQSQDDVSAYLLAAAESNRPVHELYRHLQASAAPRRLVDKTPGYAADRAILDRAEALFSAPHYIHLVRHPYAVIESFVRQRLQAIVAADVQHPYALAEEVWRQWNENILAFQAGVDPARWLRISFESLVRQPRAVMEKTAAFLGIPFDAGLLQPYSGERMIGGLGDPDIGRHDRIDAGLADRWRDVRLPWSLTAETVALAQRLGYDLRLNPAPPPDPAATLAQIDQLSDAEIEQLLQSMMTDNPDE